MTPDAELQIFAVKRGMIKSSNSFSPEYFHPERLGVIEALKNSALPIFLLKEKVSFKRELIASQKSNCHFLGLASVQSNTGECIDSEEKASGNVFKYKSGDVLYCRLRPYLNKVYLAGESGVCSTEFHVMKPKDDSILSEYLAVIMRSKLILHQTKHMMTGNTHPRISNDDVKALIIPVPNREVQQEMVTKFISALENRSNKLRQAEELLAGMDEFVLDTLGIKPCSASKKLCFAIKRKALDGVIDVKRHFGGILLGNLKVQDIANIAEQKINPQNSPDDIFDWIRIDDLSNQPLDIAEIRTESGKNIEGTFFEVFPGDILVARLGPTILNRKTVMVRTTQRRTIASAEFLVLRCKEGFSPESVMAVIKTKFFVEQMYAHARGSTPSRYRLNREDMLNLPFPDISTVQEQIRTEALYRQKNAAKLRQDAEKEWQDAREQFEKELLGE